MAIPQFKNCFDSNMGIWSSKTTIKSGGAASSYGRERCFFFPENTTILVVADAWCAIGLANEPMRILKDAKKKCEVV